MTPQEYVQLKAFARQDGLLLAFWWIGAFACYIMGLTHPLLIPVCLILTTLSPFFVGARLRRFRDYGRGGVVSFGLGYTFYILTFFYASLLLALAVYVYFAFLDKGFLVQYFVDMMHAPESREVLDQVKGLRQEMDANLEMMASLRPIDYALNFLTIIILSSFVWGIPFALFSRRRNAVNNDR